MKCLILTKTSTDILKCTLPNILKCTLLNILKCSLPNIIKCSLPNQDDSAINFYGTPRSKGVQQKRQITPDNSIINKRHAVAGVPGSSPVPFSPTRLEKLVWLGQVRIGQVDLEISLSFIRLFVDSITLSMGFFHAKTKVAGDNQQ